MFNRHLESNSPPKSTTSFTTRTTFISIFELGFGFEKIIIISAFFLGAPYSSVYFAKNEIVCHIY